MWRKPPLLEQPKRPKRHVPTMSDHQVVVQRDPEGASASRSIRVISMSSRDGAGSPDG